MHQRQSSKTPGRAREATHSSVGVPGAPAERGVKDGTKRAGDDDRLYGGAGQSRLQDANRALHCGLEEIVRDVFGADEEWGGDVSAESTSSVFCMNVGRGYSRDMGHIWMIGHAGQYATVAQATVCGPLTASSNAPGTTISGTTTTSSLPTACGLSW